MTGTDLQSEIVAEDKAKEFRLAYLQKYMGLSLEESRDLVSILTQETPKDWILPRPIRGGGTARYVPGFRFIQRLNDAFGFLWSFEVPWSDKVGGEMIAKGRLSIQVPGRTISRRLPDGTEETLRLDGFSIVKEQFGSASIKKWAHAGKDHKVGDVMDLGNDFKAASTDAMKKCGTGLGLFLDVYGARETAETAAPTETQLAAFYTRSSDLGREEEEADSWAKEKLGKPIGEATGPEVLGLVADLIDEARKREEEARKDVGT